MLFDINVDMGHMREKLMANSAIMKKQVGKYVNDRKNGVTKSKMEGCDLLSVFLESPEIFDEAAIGQHIIAFIFAATETTHYTSQTLTSMLCMRPDIAAKVR